MGDHLVTAFQCLGLAAVALAIWWVWPPLALLLVGLGVVIWAEGRKRE